MLGRRAQARARQRRAWSTSRRPLAMEDTSGSERAGVGEGACAPLRVGCARGGGGARLITRGEWVRVPGARGARRPVMRGRFGRARPLTCSPYITPKSPERGGPRVGLLWTWNFQSRGLRAPCAPCPRHRRPALHPSGYGTGGGTRSPAVPSLSLDLRSHRRPGGLAGGRRAGAAPVAAAGGRGGRSGVEGPGVGGGGGGGGETGVGAEGRGSEGRGGEEPRGPRRFRTGKLVLPKSRHPGVRTPLRSGREPPGRAGRRGSPKSGHEPGEKVRRLGHHLSPSGAGVRRNAEDQWRQAAGRPSAPGEQEARRPSAPERQRRRPEPCPRPPAPGGAPGGGGGARRGARAAAQTLYKGASPARRRRGAARTPPKFAACAWVRAAAAARAAPGPPGRNRAPKSAEPAM